MNEKNNILKKQTIEYYINGKLFKTCPYLKWNKTADNIKELLNKKGYTHIWTESWENIVDGKIYVNVKTHKCIELSYKVNTGLTDKNSYPIYEDDVIEKDGRQAKVNAHWNNETYYVRFPKYRYSCGFRLDDGNEIINLLDFKEWKKVKDAVNISKKQWKTPLKYNIKEL